jgi:rhodanese-related sulfurtransferase
MDEFERFRLEGRSPVPAVNIPYFEMLELGGKDEMLDSVVAFVERDLADQLPSDLPILAVCAKGDTSEFVAQGLRRLGYTSANLKGGMKAWGEHYATRALVEGPDLAIYQVSRPARGCFIRSIARPDLGGKAETWAPLHGRSLRRLLGLPGGITVLPGHFSCLDEADETGHFARSLDDLKKRNEGLVVLQRESEEGFVRYLLEGLPKFIPEYVDIKRVNAGLLSPTEEDAATLELGKNVCALSQAYVASGGGRQ